MTNKTLNDAEKFAATLEHEGDAELFLEMFNKGQEDMIRGHFPAFYGDTKTAAPLSGGVINDPLNVDYIRIVEMEKAAAESAPTTEGTDETTAPAGDDGGAAAEETKPKKGGE